MLGVCSYYLYFYIGIYYGLGWLMSSIYTLGVLLQWHYYDLGLFSSSVVTLGVCLLWDLLWSWVVPEISSFNISKCLCWPFAYQVLWFHLASVILHWFTCCKFVMVPLDVCSFALLIMLTEWPFRRPETRVKKTLTQWRWRSLRVLMIWTAESMKENSSMTILPKR